MPGSTGLASLLGAYNSDSDDEEDVDEECKVISDAAGAGDVIKSNR